MIKVIIPSSVVGSLFVFGKHYHKNYKYDFENEQINKHIIDWKKIEMKKFIEKLQMV